MTFYAAAQELFPYACIGDQGLSEEAQEVRRLIKGDRPVNSSYLMERVYLRVVYDLMDAMVEAANDNWDGYGATAVDPSVINYTLHFLSQLPSYYPSPEIAVDNDGDIALEWDFDARKILSIRVSRDGTLNYAGLDGLSSFYGVEILRDNIPERVLQDIDRIVGSAI